MATGMAAASLVSPTQVQAAPVASTAFASDWQSLHDRVWLGRDYWANPLQDWRIANGRIECVNPAPDRNVHLLTRSLSDSVAGFSMSVRIGRVGGGPLFGKEGTSSKGSFGFRVGVKGPLDEYRNNLIFGKGLDVGVSADGREFFFGGGGQVWAHPPDEATEVELHLSTEPASGDLWKVSFSFGPPGEGKSRSSALMEVREDFLRDRLRGNIALVANFPAPQRAGRRQQAAGGFGTGKFWFADWKLEGEKVDAHDERALGPILFSQYTLHDGIVKLTAQMPPIGEQDSQIVALQLKEADGWHTVGEERIHPQARTASFRIEKWDATKDVPYRLIYEESRKETDGTQPVGIWEGTIRRDPIDKPALTVADTSCNIHAAFPNHEYVANVAKLDPDLIAFVGDQFYESTGGYGVVRQPLETAIDDYLRKWYMHGWTWRELTRDRPSVSLPDDHDVYQGNIWGEAGAPEQGTQEAGGYNMHPAWVNVVHRTQTSHHPDAYDPTPVKQNISVYYGPLTYGRVSFAIIADRQFKTGPEGVVPPTGGRGDHVKDPGFDPNTADVPGAELLGDRQLKFLRDWATDWRGADMKCVLSQTIFASMATTHGAERMRLVADYDSNGWPQTARNAALREIRKCFAIHLAGDQHLPAVVHYGIDEHRDAGVGFAGPAVNVGYPRWWEPQEAGKNRKPGQSELLGDFQDHFGNPMTVLAVKNGVEQPSGEGVLKTMEEKASGLGIARFDKQSRTVTLECWPYLADPTKDAQFEGWPVTVRLEDNYARQPVALLPKLTFENVEHPVVQVIDHSGEVLYSLRTSGRSFQPHVFDEGSYTVVVIDPEGDRSKNLPDLRASKQNDEAVTVVL